jgi:hypothetical protein
MSFAMFTTLEDSIINPEKNSKTVPKLAQRARGEADKLKD